MGLFRTVEVFKGVPFADVPRRWEKPQAHPGWSGKDPDVQETEMSSCLMSERPTPVLWFPGVLKATKARDRCLQVNLLQTTTRGSEDCLYLNIFVPHGRQGNTHTHSHTHAHTHTRSKLISISSSAFVPT